MGWYVFSFRVKHQDTAAQTRTITSSLHHHCVN